MEKYKKHLAAQRLAAIRAAEAKARIDGLVRLAKLKSKVERAVASDK